MRRFMSLDLLKASEQFCSLAPRGGKKSRVKKSGVKKSGGKKKQE